jgi:hypothetical protein
MHIGVTGPRRLTPSQEMQAIEDLMQLLTSSTTLHAGDAKGLDALARELAENCRLYRYDAEGWKPWQLQKRSRAMVDALVVVGGTLHAWPNKACPVGLTRPLEGKRDMGDGKVCDRQRHSRGIALLNPRGNSAGLVGIEDTAIGALVKIPSGWWVLRVNLLKCQYPYPFLSRFAPLRVARSGAPQPEYEARPLSHRRGWMASPKKSPVLNAPTSRKNEQTAHP